MNCLIWYLSVFLAILSSLRNQILKYLKIDIDWHLIFHIYVLFLFFLFVFKILINIQSFKIKKYDFKFLILLFLFLLFGLLYNNYFVTYYGLFEYIYIFLFPYLLSFFYISKKTINILIKIFKFWVWFMVLVAIYQSFEFLLYYKLKIIPFAIFSRHNLNQPDLIRLGLLRSPSLMGSPTEWGSVAVLYLLMLLVKNNFKINFSISILIFSFIITVTRSLYMCLLGVLLIIIILPIINAQSRNYIRKNRLFLTKILFLIFSFILIGIGINFIFSIYKKPEFLINDHLRGFAFYVATKVDNKLIGLGPGRFGSYVSFILNSPYLSKYGLLSTFPGVTRIKTIDSFWLQVFIEMGITGLILILILFYSMFKSNWLIYKKLNYINDDYFLIRMISFSVIFVPVIYMINGIGFTTFIPSFVGWSSVLIGIVWSYRRNMDKLTKNENTSNK